MGIKEDLTLNYEDFTSSADDEFKKKKYNPSVSSYFKAIVILCDLKIYIDRNILPKNHTERFYFMDQHYPLVYPILNRMFKKYRDSYNLRLDISDALELRENVKKIENLLGFEKIGKNRKG